VFSRKLRVPDTLLAGKLTPLFYGQNCFLCGCLGSNVALHSGLNNTLALLICVSCFCVIKAQRLSWFGHLHRMPEERMVKRVHKWKPKQTRPLGRPKNRWEDDIINDMKKLKINNWTGCIQGHSK
jgi:hypothetical protein